MAGFLEPGTWSLAMSDAPNDHADHSDLRALIRDVPDFPKPGIVFKDITPLLANGPALAKVVEEIALACEREGIQADVLACPEARGFIFGSALALRLGVGFVPIRKPGKLPYEKVAVEYALEYGTDRVEMHADAVLEGQRVVLVDDVLATGGTTEACIELIEKCGAQVEAGVFLLELDFLSGRDKLAGYPVVSLLHY